MRLFGRIIRGLVLAVVMLVTALVFWLSFSPPALLRVGTGYAAKIVCSNVFLAGRDPENVLAADVQAPGHPLLRLVSVDVDREARSVTAQLPGAIAASTAIYREGLGCSNVPDGGAVADTVQPPPLEPQRIAADAPWPAGDRVEAAEPAIAGLLADPALAGPGMRAIVVVKDGGIVAETYGGGFSHATPLLGWSMAKTVNAAVLGRLVAEGRLGLDDSGLFSGWKDDQRGTIRVRDLMAMESGLEFNEDYGDVTDVTRMLYLERDMAAYAADKPEIAGPGEVFNYSSGTSVLLARVWMDRFRDQSRALAYPETALFAPLGMTSALMEADAAGTFVGSSYVYATARDWARFGLFLLQDGVWNGNRLLPEGYVAMMQQPTVASNNRFTKGQAWQEGPGGVMDQTFGLPADAYWMLGHDGQSVTIVPSERLVVVRLGLTPSKLGYRPQKLVKAVMDGLR
ncbi:serine hydrolase domain-containing protein [Rhizobium cremeum]|uniref:serine hydrolase domain-containing protein n=1 Tax=Rhizobium cremeum TaxID=2813827 RepID=UPI000DE4038C